MKKISIEDERIVAQKRKIGSDTFGILYFGLILSILIQQFMFKAPFSQYAAEFVLFMVAAIYVVVRNIMVGNDLYKDSDNGLRLVVLNSVVCGLSISAVTTTLNANNLGLEKMGGANGIAISALTTFVFGALASFMVFGFLNMIVKKRQKQIEDKYNDTDQ